MRIRRSTAVWTIDRERGSFAIVIAAFLSLVLIGAILAWLLLRTEPAPPAPAGAQPTPAPIATPVPPPSEETPKLGSTPEDASSASDVAESPDQSPASSCQ